MKHKYAVFRFLITATGGCAWNSVKNCFKLLIGRSTYGDGMGLFLRQYILHLTGLRPIRKITSRGLRSEGAASQALMIMNAMNFAHSFGLIYAHSRFTQIQHAERPMEEWITAWESLFNLGAGEIPCGTESLEVVDFCRNLEGLDLCFGSRSRWDELADRFKTMIPEFRDRYYLQKSRRTTGTFTVAVHIRRGDVSAANPDYFTPNETILRTMASVQSILDAQKLEYSTRVYSQGNCDDFPEFSRKDVELFLDADAVWTMRELIEADILIMAHGCYSYYAGLISDGIKIFEPISLSGDHLLPGWKWRSLPPAASWIPCLGDGSFDRAAFEHQLVLAMKAKTPASARIPAGDSDQESEDPA